ncbi:CLUMA_CG000918, isoform A [Clunio marinus]|uniref:CLUMA_CG000918, isoform A n=1 Tax=Clunio marinus TaxID=568069 RepID=A0A1J1HKR5_9DIPT|nr:CLUMA_CG000918, isoform A [Clunio marinus]
MNAHKSKHEHMYIVHTHRANHRNRKIRNCIDRISFRCHKFDHLPYFLDILKSDGAQRINKKLFILKYLPGKNINPTDKRLIFHQD